MVSLPSGDKSTPQTVKNNESILSIKIWVMKYKHVMEIVMCVIKPNSDYTLKYTINGNCRL